MLIHGSNGSFNGICGRFFYVVGLPLCLGFWITIPDCRRPMFEKFWYLTFFGCIAWIGGLCYFMVQRLGSDALLASIQL